MELLNALDRLNEEERNMYIENSTRQCFTNMYYSEEFACILKKLNTNEKLASEEWDYIVTRLFLITCKAKTEEMKVTFMDRIIYLLSRLGLKIGTKDGNFYNECFKMIRFIDSIDKEKEINRDLADGLTRVFNDGNDTNLDILIRQHREANIFRNNQDEYIDIYKESSSGIINANEKMYISSMNSAYIREKELVKEYK